jgi:hypothetical protein
VTVFQTDESTAPLPFPANQHHSVQVPPLFSEVTVLHSTASLPFQSPPVYSEVSLDESTTSSDEQNLNSTHHVNFLIHRTILAYGFVEHVFEMNPSFCTFLPTSIHPTSNFKIWL